MKVYSTATGKAVLLLSMAVMLSAAPTFASAQNSDTAFKKRVVETLLDTDLGIIADKNISVTAAEAHKYIRQDSFGGTTFSRVSKTDFSVPEIEYRLTVGRVNTSYLKRQWWTKIKGGDAQSLQIWARKISDFSSAYIEFLAIKPEKGYVFEVRLMHADVDEGRGIIHKKMKLFLKNAKLNGVFRKPSEEATTTRVAHTMQPEARASLRTNSSESTVVVEKQASKPQAAPKKLAPVRKKSIPMNDKLFIGTWKGPMTNSKGSRSAASALTIFLNKRGIFHGKWHNGWVFSNGKRENDTVSFNVNKVGNGCRDYKVSFTMHDDRHAGSLSYKAEDRCGKVKYYTGKAELTRQ